MLVEQSLQFGSISQAISWCRSQGLGAGVKEALKKGTMAGDFHWVYVATN
jgi:hypothetical protein